MKLSFPLNTVTQSRKVHSNIAKARRYKAKAFLSGGRINKTALRGVVFVCLSVQRQEVVQTVPRTIILPRVKKHFAQR